MNDKITWTCLVCGDERPDDLISVYTTEVPFAGVTMKINVRYCNDRPACLEGAPARAERMAV